MVELQEARSNYLDSIQEGVVFLREHGLVETARHAADIMMGRFGSLTTPPQAASLVGTSACRASLQVTTCCSTVNCVLVCRIEPQRLPHYLEEEAEDLFQKIGDAWNKVANMPPGIDRLSFCTTARHIPSVAISSAEFSCVDTAVAKVVATAQPPVEYTCGKYREAHNAIVSSAAYNRALDIADGVVKRVQVSIPLLNCSEESLQ